MKLDNLRNNLKKYERDIMSKSKEIKDFNTEEDLMDTLCFSFSDIVVDFILDNKKEDCFNKEINNEKYLGNIDKYIENVLYDWKTELPFSNMNPVEFFDTLRDFKI